MKHPYKDIPTGSIRDARNANNENWDVAEANEKELAASILANKNAAAADTKAVDDRLTSVKKELDDDLTEIDKKVEDVNNKAVHFDSVDEELSEHADLLAQLKASSIDGEVIAARNGFPSLLDFLKSLNPGVTVATKTFIAGDGQINIDLTDTGELQAIGKVILFLIDGAPQWDSYTWTNSKTLTMKSAFAGGEQVFIRYFIGNISLKTGHNRGHEKGGYDELDVYLLKNGDVTRDTLEALTGVQNYITSYKKETSETSDSKRIQRAIDASVGKSLKFSRTTYTLDETVKIPSNSKIDFNGAIFQRKAGTTTFDMLVNADTTNGNSDIYLENLLIDGNKEIDNLVATTVNHRFSGLKLVKVTNSVISDITVTRTINGEDQGNNPLLRPAAGIYFIDCNMRAYNINGYNNDRTAIFLSRGTVRINGSKTYNNLGSGISSTDSPYSEYINIESYNNGYTNVSVNGIESKVQNVRTWGSTFSGLTVGHGTSPSHGSQVDNITSFDNTYEGVTIGGSIGVQLTNLLLYRNARDNIRVFDNASDVQLLNVKSYNSPGSGVRFYSGKNHSIDNSDFYNNSSYGIYVDVGVANVKVGANVRGYNNVLGGCLLSQAINCEINRSSFYDDQTTKTQDAGLYISGGSGHIINMPNLYGNKTYQIRKASSPTNLKESYTFPTTTDYTTITPSNGWTGVATRYSRSADNIVRLEGTVDGTNSTNPIFITLPVGLRPNATLRFPTVANGVFAEIVVNSSGEIIVSGGLKTAISLNTVAFKAVQ